MFLIFVLVLFAVNTQAADTCITPNDETAECIPLKSCPILSNVMNDPNAYAFLQLSACGSRIDDNLVCCGTSSNFKEERNTFSDEKVCGLQHADDYEHSIDRPVLTELPWLALIGYKDKNEAILPFNERYKCSGSLISKRHILTSAKCLTQTNMKPYSVRLGEYDTANDTDCIEDSTLYECADAVQDFGIENIIVHPNYNKKRNKNDIGLIKLDKTVLYSDYIRPICLPTPEKTKAKVGDTLVTAGWGKKRTSASKETKMITFSTLKSSRECQSHYNISNKFINSVMCGVPKNDSGVCYGDAGGPVIFSHKWRWHQEGIISYSKDCGSHFPEVYTRVEYYLNWIKENLEL